MMNYVHAVVHIIFTLVIYLGLPMVGWGLGNIDGFYSQPARVGYAVLIGIAAVQAAYQGLVIPEERGQAEKRVTRQTVFFVVSGLLGMALLLFMPFCDRHGIAVLPDYQWIRYLGLGLSALGGFVAFLSVLNLGRQYSPEVTIQSEHKLITTGLYHYIRHPRYLGLFVLILGFALIFRAWVGVILDLVLLGALIWRISDEEKMLHQEFGEGWEVYVRHTWRLLPYIF